MAELEQVMEALRKADSAGNTEDAKKLAIIANKLRGTPQAKQESLGAMPFVNRAISSTLGAPADLIRSGINLIPGVELPEAVGGRKSIEKGMELLGARLPEEGRGPETMPEYIGAGVGEVAALMVPAGQTVRVLKGGAGLASQVAGQIAKSMVKHPYLTMGSELTGGVGIGVGRGIAEQQFPDSPMARTATEIAGGIAGSMAPTLAINAPTAIAIRSGKQVLQKLTLPFSKKGGMFRAGEVVKGKAAFPTVAAKEAGKETISRMPPAVATGEKKIIELYKALIGQDPATDAGAIEKLSQSIVKLEGEMRKLGYGSPELLEEITRKRIAALELRMDKRVIAAAEKAQKRIDALPVAERRVHEARIVRQELDGARIKEYAGTQKKWLKVNKDLESGFEKTRETYGSLLDDLADDQFDDIPDVLKRSKIINNEKLESTTVKQMQGLRSKLLETRRQAQEARQWNKARIAGDVADAILDDLDLIPGDSNLRAALAATRNYKTRFESGITGKILGLSREGAPAIHPDLTLQVSIGRMMDRGSIDIEKVVVTPEAVAAARRYVARSFTDYAQDTKSGSVNPVKAERWVKNNEAILDKFPGMRDQLTDAAGAQKIADDTRIRMDTRKKALRDPKVSVSARFLNATDMNTEVRSILKAKNPARMADELVRQAGKDTTGEALEGLRGGFVDYILETSSIGPFNDQGVQTISGRTMHNFLNKNFSVLQKVFTRPQIAKMRTVARELTKIETFEKVPYGKPGLEFKDFASNALRVAAEAKMAQVGGQVGGGTLGGSMKLASLFAGKAKKAMTWLTKDRAEQLVHDAILADDPKLLQSLLLPLDKPSVAKENLIILNRALNLWLAGPGKRVMDDIEQEFKGE